MALSSWFCTNSTKNMLVKIVHPGGHVELHDRPVLAAEIMLRNPRCCVAHPHVFRQPWAIVAPDTTLMLGQKFYVVPISTIRKLQRLSLKNSPSLVQETQTSQSCKDDGPLSCCLFKNKSPKDNCLACLFTGMKIKAANSTEDPSKEARSSSTSSSIGSSETTRLSRKRTEDVRSPRRSLSSFDHWQPRLESINEE